MPNAKRNDQLHLHFIVFIWGFTAVIGALISIDAIPLVWYRTGLAVLVLLLYAILFKKSLKKKPKDILKFLFVGLFIAIHWISFFYAIKISNVSITLAAISTGALFATFIEPIFYKKKIVWYEVLFSVIAILGLLVIFQVQAQFTLGIIFGLIAAFLSALFAVLNSKLIKTHEALSITFYELLSGFLLISVLLYFNGTMQTPTFFKLSLSDFMLLFILASICTAYTMVASTKLLLKMSPFTMMLTINLEPVYGIALAVIILGDSEKMTPQFYLGTALIIISILLNAAFKRYPRIILNKKQ